MLQMVPKSEPSPVIPRPSNRDLRLHALSLQIAATYREMHEDANRNDEACEDLLTAYRSVRRHIGNGPDGKRWGHESAHRIMGGNV